MNPTAPHESFVQHFRGYSFWSNDNGHYSIIKDGATEYEPVGKTSVAEVEEYIRSITRKFWIQAGEDGGLFEGPVPMWENNFGGLTASPFNEFSDEELIEYLREWAVGFEEPIKIFAPNEVLDLLAKERQKFTKANSNYMQHLVEYLVEMEVYPAPTPTMEKQNLSYLRMVECWGAHWHEWRGVLKCPHCEADLRNVESGPPFKREIGIEIQGWYDGVLYYQCPDCKGKIERPGFEKMLAEYEASL